MKGIIAGVIAGFAGALAWAAIAIFTGFEIGWLAWGIGAAVGAAVAWGSKGTSAMGIAAVAISILAIVGGKYISVEMLLAKQVENYDQQIAQHLKSEDYLISWLAGSIITQIQDDGGTIDWPKGVNPEEVEKKSDYPPAIWSKAEQMWSEMPQDKRDEFKDSVRSQIYESLTAFKADVRKEGFLASFSIMDIIFFFFAIGTAYKIASKKE